MKNLVSILILCVAVANAQEYYKGIQIIKVWPKTEVEHEILSQIEDKFGFEIWQRAFKDREAQVLVPHDRLMEFETIMKENSIYFERFIEDVERFAENEMLVNERARANVPEGKFSFTAYHRYDEIVRHLEELQDNFPGRISIGVAKETMNGLNITYALISNDFGSNGTRPVIVVDAGIHGNEWMGPPMAMYIIDKLVKNITEDDVANGIDWVVIPVLNPDGYEYAHTTARMWRKNRSTVDSSTCPGVDCNRNFGYKWMESGGSANPCSVNYAGPFSFSEEESRAVRDLINRYRSRVRASLSVHSHGSYIIYPFGHDGSDPSNVEELHAVGTAMAKAIDDGQAPGSRNYSVGNAAALLNYNSAGASTDWNLGAANVSLAFTLELPSGGTSGFDPPPSRIMQTVTETWEGVLVLARYVLDGTNG